MKYEKPEMEIEVFDSDIYTAGGLITSSNEGGVDPWPFGENQEVQNLSIW